MWRLGILVVMSLAGACQLSAASQASDKFTAPDLPPVSCTAFFSQTLPRSSDFSPVLKELRVNLATSDMGSDLLLGVLPGDDANTLLGVLHIPDCQGPQSAQDIAGVLALDRMPFLEAAPELTVRTFNQRLDALSLLLDSLGWEAAALSRPKAEHVQALRVVALGAMDLLARHVRLESAERLYETWQRIVRDAHLRLETPCDGALDYQRSTQYSGGEVPGLEESVGLARVTQRMAQRDERSYVEQLVFALDFRDPEMLRPLDITHTRTGDLEIAQVFDAADAASVFSLAAWMMQRVTCTAPDVSLPDVRLRVRMRDAYSVESSWDMMTTSPAGAPRTAHQPRPVSVVVQRTAGPPAAFLRSDDVQSKEVPNGQVIYAADGASVKLHMPSEYVQDTTAQLFLR